MPRARVIGDKRLREFEKRAADRLIKEQAAQGGESDFDPSLLEFMTEEERALFNGS